MTEDSDYKVTVKEFIDVNFGIGVAEKIAKTIDPIISSIILYITNVSKKIDKSIYDRDILEINYLLEAKKIGKLKNCDDVRLRVLLRRRKGNVIIGREDRDRIRLHRRRRGGRPNKAFLHRRPIDIESLPLLIERAYQLFDPETPPDKRLTLLKRTPWWPLIVDAVYRGEYAQHQRSHARAEETRSELAERSANVVLKITPSRIRRERTLARRLGETLPNMTATEFSGWLETGQPPWML